MPNQFNTPRPVVGDTFSRLTVIGPVYGKNKKTWAVCRCLCGAIRTVWVAHLRNGHTKSCGCLSRELIRERSRTHGDSATSLHAVWRAIKGRCLNPNDQAYPHYGGRGIGICAEWVRDFVAFRDWAIANGWNHGLHTHRIDNNGPYSPGNVAFVTPFENSQVKRITKYLTVFGETRLLVDWARDTRCLVSRLTLYKRLDLGWEPERALITPSQQAK